MDFSQHRTLKLRHRLLLERLLAPLRLDIESFLGLAARVASSGAYFVTAFMTTHFLSPQNQGAFFTFLSFAALTVFVELGLNTVVIQFVAHEKAVLETAPYAAIRADAVSRLQSIGGFAFVWFWAGAAFFFIGLSLGGLLFFSGTPEASAVLPWPWLLLVTGVSLDLVFFPFLGLLEGIRRIEFVYAYRLGKALAIGIGTWLSLALGLGLLSLSFGYFLAIPLGLWMIWTNRDFFRLFLLCSAGPRVGWRKEMWPLHWRIASSWIAGYFAVWAVTPITYKLLGSAAAGRIGFTWSIAAGLSSIASAVVMVKFAHFGQLVATRRFAELDHQAMRQGLLALGLITIGACIVLAMTWLAQLRGMALAQRMLPLGDVTLFMIGITAQQITLPMAVYLRSFKREPYLWLSVISSVALITMVVVLGRIAGEHGVAVAYALIMAGGLLPAGTLIFWHYRRRWAVLGE